MTSITVSEAAKAVVRRNTEEVQGRGNFDVFDKLFADDFTPRALHTATLRSDGTVLRAGGDTYFYNGLLGRTLSAAEVFDPITDTFTAVADMTAPRESHTATLLLNGEVLVVGGSNGTLGYSVTATVFATAELYE